MPRIPAGIVTGSGEVIPDKPEKQAKPKKKTSVPQDWKTKDKRERQRKKTRSRK